MINVVTFMFNIFYYQREAASTEIQTRSFILAIYSHAAQKPVLHLDHAAWILNNDYIIHSHGLR